MSQGFQFSAKRNFRLGKQAFGAPEAFIYWPQNRSSANFHVQDWGAYLKIVGEYLKFCNLTSPGSDIHDFSYIPFFSR